MPNPYVVILNCFARLPTVALPALGWLVGQLLWYLAPSRRHIAITNLQLCLPNLTTQERRKLAHKSFVTGGQFLVECGPVWLGSADKLRERVDLSPAQQQLAEIKQSNTGAIVATPHLGNWEVAGLILGEHLLNEIGKPSLTSLYKPQQGEVDELILKARQRTGSELAPADMQGVRRALKTLREGGIVGILPDQEVPSGSGVWAPFFGIPASTMTIVNRLGRKTNVPLYITWAERQANGRDFKIQLVRVDDNYANDSALQGAKTMNEAIEAAIMRCPDQYWWSYKRMRHRPQGFANIYRRS